MNRGWFRGTRPLLLVGRSVAIAIGLAASVHGQPQAASRGGGREMEVGPDRQF